MLQCMKILPGNKILLWASGRWNITPLVVTTQYLAQQRCTKTELEITTPPLVMSQGTIQLVPPMFI